MDAFIGYTIAGLAIGAIYAIAATGLVVTYTTSGVFNFAHGATGMLLAFLYWQFRFGWHWAAPAALCIVLLVVAPLYGVLTERVLIRPLDPGDTGTTLIVTVGLLVASLGIAYTAWEPQKINHTMFAFFGSSAFVTLGHNRISYQDFVNVGLAIGVAVGLRFLFYRTRIGVAMRGVVDDRPLMALNGGYPYRLNALSWAIGASLAGLAGILQATFFSGGLQVVDLTFLVVSAYAAALLGRLKNLPLTFAAAFGLGLLRQYLTGYTTFPHWLSPLESDLPTAFLFVVLLGLPALRLRAGAATVTNALRVPSFRRSLVSAAGFLAAAAVVIQFLHGRVLIGQAGEGAGLAIVGLSVVLLTGYGGQVSLAPYTFMGFGAWVFAKISPGGSLLGLLLAGLVTAGLGAIVALPALRLRGLYLALSTLAFAELAYSMFFNQPSIIENAFHVPVPRVPFVSLRGGRADLLFECVVFAILAVAVLAVRRSSVGRLLMATRDSSTAAATLGANLPLTKLLIFASASGIAGIGGALWGGVERSIISTDFVWNLGLSIVLLVYIWGVSSPAGAFFGALSFAILYPQISPHLPDRWSQVGLILTGLGAVSLGRNPNGIVGQISDAWHGFSPSLPWKRTRPAQSPWAFESHANEEVRTLATADR